MVLIAGDNTINVQIDGGPGNDGFALTAGGLDQVFIQGGSGDDGLTIEGSTGGRIEFQGQDGADFFFNNGEDYQQLTFLGGPAMIACKIMAIKL